MRQIGYIQLLFVFATSNSKRTANLISKQFLGFLILNVCHFECLTNYIFIQTCKVWLQSHFPGILLDFWRFIVHVYTSISDDY